MRDSNVTAARAAEKLLLTCCTTHNNSPLSAMFVFFAHHVNSAQLCQVTAGAEYGNTDTKCQMENNQKEKKNLTTRAVCHK